MRYDVIELASCTAKYQATSAGRAWETLHGYTRKSGPGSGICEMLAICLRAATIAGTAFYGCRLAPSMRPNAWKEIRGIYWLCYRDLGVVDGGHHTTFFFHLFALQLKILTSFSLLFSLLQMRTIRKRACLSTTPGLVLF